MKALPPIFKVVVKLRLKTRTDCGTRALEIEIFEEKSRQCIYEKRKGRIVRLS